MKISFRQSGGITGSTFSCEIDTRTLPGAEVAKIENLVKIAGFLKPKTAGIIGFLKSKITFSSTGACDILDYGISVESGGITYHVAFNDLTIPEDGRPLLDYLKKHARPQRR